MHQLIPYQLSSLVVHVAERDQPTIPLRNAHTLTDKIVDNVAGLGDQRLVIGETEAVHVGEAEAVRVGGEAEAGPIRVHRVTFANLVNIVESVLEDHVIMD